MQMDVMWGDADIDAGPRPEVASKRVRTRTGCWNCRRRRKKCDEQRPTCTNCRQKSERCEWGVKLSFRSENVQSLPPTHPSMRRDAGNRGSNNKVEIFDVTREVIRDYWNDSQMLDNGDTGSPVQTPTLTSSDTAVMSPSIPIIHTVDRGDGAPLPFSLPIIHHDSPASANSHDMTRSAAANLLDLSRGSQASPAAIEHISPPIRAATMSLGPGSTPMEDMLFMPATSPASSSDGIFVPGSAYLEWHSTLRHHMFDITKSLTPTWEDALEIPRTENRAAEAPNATPAPPATPSPPIVEAPGSTVPTPKAAELEPQEEYELWKNWTDEVAPWLDKFDNDCHFQRRLPLLAKYHAHLRYSILALSARQLERKMEARDNSKSLSLYQEAIHLLIPQLETGNTAVVASCVVLCVLEMMSCSPRMWRRHLEGCARLIQSLGIHGFSGGLEQALFWCFARMDVCGGLISSERTLIPVGNWTPKSTLAEQVQLFRGAPCFHMYASYLVFLCANVLDFLSSKSCDQNGRRWLEIYGCIGDWYTNRPPELEPILELSASDKDFSRPFPTILFSNGPAISGNQLYHTAAILMLQSRPQEVAPPSKQRSILWHARRICAISISNTHHGCWTNAVQPLWIAGRLMSHPAEHQAVLETYQMIERETGWGANWRAKDLRDFWGELNDE